MIMFLGISVYAQSNINGDLSKPASQLNYIAVGSSLSAGVSNSGLTSESQKSAFPNLIATQMKLTNFMQDLLDDSVSIGTEKVDYRGGVLRFIDTATPSGKVSRLPKAKEDVSNFAIPFLKISNILVNETMEGSFLPSFERKSYNHIYRFTDQQGEGKVSYLDIIDKRVKNVDFFTFEIGMHDLVSYYKSGGQGQPISLLTNEREGYFPENYLIQLLTSRGARGVMANVPDVLEFPFFRSYGYDEMKTKVGEEIYTEFNGKLQVRKAHSGDCFIPNSNTSLLFTSVGSIGRSREEPLSDEDVIGTEEQVDVRKYNSWLGVIADLNNIPLVDLHKLYSQILSGTYVSEDGVKIDPSYPAGNFFSNDGIHPTKIGQAVIANEFIKSINVFYHANIPLVKIKDIK